MKKCDDEIVIKPVYLCTSCREPSYSISECDNCGKEIWGGVAHEPTEKLENEVRGERAHQEIKDWSKLTR